MTDFKALIQTLQDTVNNFSSVIPDIQEKIFARLKVELSQLETKSGNIVANVKNLRLIAAIKAKIESLILSPEYLDNVKEYARAFAEITQLQNQYFNTLKASYKPPEFAAELKKQAIEAVVDSLTEKGLAGNVVAAVGDILVRNITTGGSVAALEEALKQNIVNTSSGDGTLMRYTKQITTDALNQYSAQYTQIVTNDLGLEWFKYSGSLLTTSRPWCIAMVQKQWIHISEFPALLKGDFPEFKEAGGKLYKGLPAGMIADTTPANLQTNRGGHGCGHQMRPVSENLVPEAAKNAVYATAAYKAWKAGRS